MLRRDPPECYHLVLPDQPNSADDLKHFRAVRYGRAAAIETAGKDIVTYVHTPLSYVSENDADNGIKIPNSIERVVFKNVVETAVQVSGHEGVWHEGSPIGGRLPEHIKVVVSHINHSEWQ